MVVNVTNIKAASDGIWEGDNPLKCAFPLLIVQVILVLFSSRFLAFLLRPLRQPKVVAEILVSSIHAHTSIFIHKMITFTSIYNNILIGRDIVGTFSIGEKQRIC